MITTINKFTKIYENNTKLLFVDESKMKSLLLNDKDFSKGDIIQAFYNIIYSECDGNVQCVGKNLGQLPLFVELFGNYNGQVNNGGHTQYFDNGYASSYTSGFGGNHTEIDQHDDFVELFRDLNMISILGKKAYSVINDFEFDGETEPDECYNCNGDGRTECVECEGNTRITCPDCDGEGELYDDDEEEGETCSTCSGDGEIECEECDGDGDVHCVNCDGSGEGEEIEVKTDWDNLDTRWYEINDKVEKKLNKYLKSLTLDGEKITYLLKIASEHKKYNL